MWSRGIVADPWGRCACSRSAFYVAASSGKPGVRCRRSVWAAIGSLGRQVAGGGPGECVVPGPGLPIPIRWHYPAGPRQAARLTRRVGGWCS